MASPDMFGASQLHLFDRWFSQRSWDSVSANQAKLGRLMLLPLLPQEGLQKVKELWLASFKKARLPQMVGC